MSRRSNDDDGCAALGFIVFLGVMVWLGKAEPAVLGVLVGVGIFIALAWWAVGVVRARFARCVHGVYVNRGPCVQCEREARALADAVEKGEAERARQAAECQRVRDEEERRLRREAAKKVHQLSHLRGMSYYQFEEFVLEIYRRLGWEARGTPASGDHGIDGYLKKGGGSFVLQCKKYDENVKVGEPDLHALLGVAAKEKAHGGILVTTSDFTEKGRAWARNEPRIILVDGDALLKLIECACEGSSELPAWFALTEKEASQQAKLTCPLCGKTTRIVHGKYGEFVGCIGYPACRWTSEAPAGSRSRRKRRKGRRKW